jgi:hypothetical protein
VDQAHRDLNTEEYRDLLLTALPSSLDADTLRPDLHTLYTPTSHRNALDPDATVVRGARGVGKTVWYSALQNRTLREVAAADYEIARLRSAESITGYGSELKPEAYPGPATMANLTREGVEPDDIWTSVLLQGLGVNSVTRLASWSEKIAWVQSNPEARDRAIAAADHTAGDARMVKLILFDALDRLSPSRATAERLIAGILRLALDLRTGTRNLRAKVFIRHDMFDDVNLHFPDASKLTANAADLTWTSVNLYGLLFHYLGNVPGELSERYRSTERGWPYKTGWQEDSGRYTPPVELMAYDKSQQLVFERIAGPYMGTDPRKGRPYTWLHNHLVDGIRQVSPRSFLSALRRAAEETAERYPHHPYALHWEGIRVGVQAASKIRVEEVKEDLPWVGTAIAPLEGLQVPMEESVVTGRWTEHGLAKELAGRWGGADVVDDSKVRAGPRHIDDYVGLVRELIDLGVMTRRVDHRVDLPDVYRVAFRIGRKGGVPKLRR